MPDTNIPQTQSKIFTIIEKIFSSARKNTWQFLGALVMETKDGKQAVSLNRVLTITTYIAFMHLVLGHAGEIAPDVKAALDAAKIDVPKALQAAAGVPDALLYTLWGMLGITGGTKLISVIKGPSNDA